MKKVKGSYFSPDIQEFLLLLAEHEVRYVIVGGEAVIYYGYARLTGDVDFFYEASPENVQKLYDALLEFWEHNIPGIEKPEELLEPGVILQFGVVPNRMDLLNRMDNLNFEEVWANRETFTIKIHRREIPVYFIGLDQLIKNKEAVARYKDLEDLKYLKKVQQQRK
ncbi:MAG: hypothetical protein D6681_06540 [Calditrichaeota bacterium]|nr:MAG: hypothetical protein D6681_06540 [Calditrichota bacterium]